LIQIKASDANSAHKVARQILKRAGCYSVHSGLTGRARQERARHGFMA